MLFALAGCRWGSKGAPWGAQRWGLPQHQAMSACSSTPYPNVGDYEGWTGLSPPTAYPSTMEYKINEGIASSLDTTSTLLTTTLASIRVIRLYSEPSTRVSTMGTDDEPTNK
jgi:hypothetical protein